MLQATHVDVAKIGILLMFHSFAFSPWQWSKTFLYCDISTAGILFASPLPTTDYLRKWWDHDARYYEREKNTNKALPFSAASLCHVGYVILPEGRKKGELGKVLNISFSRHTVKIKGDKLPEKIIMNVPFMASFCDMIQAISTSIGTCFQNSWKERKRLSGSGHRQLNNKFIYPESVPCSTAQLWVWTSAILSF